MANKRTIEILIAVEAVKKKSKAVDLIENFFPTHVPRLFQVQEKLLNIKRSVNHMLHNEPTFVVDENPILICL